jgi:diguanylate cyclase (GGDEF)-like protein/PAS domain S-box-containing protein
MFSRRKGLRPITASGSGRRPIVAIFLTFALISAATIALSVHTTKGSEHRTSVIQIAARQRTLAERYVEETLLVREGRTANPAYTAGVLQASAAALLGGGNAPGVNGDADETKLPAAEDTAIQRQFALEQRLVADLTSTGEAVLAHRSTAALPETAGERLGTIEPIPRLRVVAALTSSIAFRAAREIGRTDESNIAGLLTSQIVLGLGGLLITLLLAAALLAATRRQSAHFRSLALSSTDLVVVLGSGGARYVSRSVSALVGRPESELYADGLMRFVHEEDRPLIERVRTDGEPSEFTFRMRSVADEWRRLEARTTDLREDRNLRGVVIHARDATDRVGLEEELTAKVVRDGFANQLSEAMEMADDEHEVFNVVERGMVEIEEGTPMELLLSDSSRANLGRVASNPDREPPACPVKSPFSCVAVRRGTAVVFDSSEDLNACPHLRGRASGPCSAVCVPVSFMGRALGVLHTTGPDAEPLGDGAVAQLSVLAGQSGARIGTVRAFEKTQLQASTDGLTGLVNRRTGERRLRELVRAGHLFAVAIGDLDHFKQLNDTHGHEAGDRALRLFSQTVKRTLREHDMIARWGGEEFVLALPELDRFQAVAILDRVRHNLAVAHPGETPRFTVSFGVSDSTCGMSVETLLSIADRGLYAAKQGGRDRSVIGDPEAAAPGDVERYATIHSEHQPRAEAESAEEDGAPLDTSHLTLTMRAAADEEEPRPSGVEIR